MQLSELQMKRWNRCSLLLCELEGSSLVGVTSSASAVAANRGGGISLLARLPYTSFNNQVSCLHFGIDSTLCYLEVGEVVHRGKQEYSVAFLLENDGSLPNSPSVEPSSGALLRHLPPATRSLGPVDGSVAQIAGEDREPPCLRRLLSFPSAPR